jgi:hypothetical protein
MLAEAMLDDAWNFKPRAGAFENARTFAEQIKHVACSNFAFADQTLGQKPPEHCEASGPDPAKTKTELMKYLRDSFRKMDEAISRTNDKNIFNPSKRLTLATTGCQLSSSRFGTYPTTTVSLSNTYD